MHTIIETKNQTRENDNSNNRTPCTTVGRTKPSVSCLLAIFFLNQAALRTVVLLQQRTGSAVFGCSNPFAVLEE